VKLTYNEPFESINSLTLTYYDTTFEQFFLKFFAILRERERERERE